MDVLASPPVANLSATARPVARMERPKDGHASAAKRIGRLPDSYLGERHQPDFSLVLQLAGGLLGDSMLRVHRSHSEQRTRAAVSRSSRLRMQQLVIGGRQSRVSER